MATTEALHHISNPHSFSPPLKQSPSESLRRSVSSLFLANVTNAAAQCGIIVYLAKSANPTIVGEFTLGVAISAPIMMLAMLNLRTQLATDQSEIAPFASYLTLRVGAIMLALAVLWIVTSSPTYPTETAAVILSVGLLKAIESIGDIFHGYLQKHNSIKPIAISTAMKGIAGFATLVAAMTLTGNLVVSVFLMALSSLMLLMLYDMPVTVILSNRLATNTIATPSAGKQLNYQHVLRRMAPLVAIGVPLGIAVFLNSLNLNTPRYIISAYWGPAEMGIFAALTYFMRVGFYFETALTLTALPRLATLYNDRKLKTLIKTLATLLLCATSFGAICFVATTLFGETILRILFTEEYAMHTHSLQLLVIAATIGYAAGLVKSAVDASRSFAIQLPLLAMVAAITTIAGFLLIPQFGIQGAAITMIVSRIALLLGYASILTYLVYSESPKQLSLALTLKRD